MKRGHRTIYAPGQDVLFEPESDWRLPSLSELPSWEGAKRVSIDCETRDERLREDGIGVRHGGHTVGYSFAIEDGPSFYLPFGHARGGNLDKSHVVAYLKDQAKVFTGSICGAHLQYDLDYAAEDGVVFRRAAWFRDVQVADPLINELHYSYSLESICERHGLPGKDEDTLRRAAAVFGVDPKSGLWQLHSRYVGRYAEADARRPLEVLRKQERIIDDEDLWGIYDLESKVLPVLVKMRRRGVLIDQKRMAEAEVWTLAEEKKCLDEVERLTGFQVGVGNVWKTDAMAEPLRRIGVTIHNDKNGNPMVNADMLEATVKSDGTQHPVAAALARARKINKARTSFLDSIKHYLTKQGRVHATFNQLKREKSEGEEGTKGAAYGRLSCEHPNLQQQPSPSRDPEIGKLVRSIYIPEPGCRWASNDYSQQEPRWTVHFAEVCGLRGAKAAAERYRNDPTADSHDMMTELIYGPTWKQREDKKQLRFGCKTIFLGLCYGMGGPKLCGELGLPTRYAVKSNWNIVAYAQTMEEATDKARGYNDAYVFQCAGEKGQALLDLFNDKVPFVRDLQKLCERRAGQNGFIKTVLGRHCRFPRDDNGRYDWLHKALNRLIQGSSGDQVKKAMVDADAEGVWLQIQVHDELGQSVQEQREAERLAEIMKHCTPCNVPMRVDVELADNWGGAG